VVYLFCLLDFLEIRVAIQRYDLPFLVGHSLVAVFWRVDNNDIELWNTDTN
jgi:hypothetical protein